MQSLAGLRRGAKAKLMPRVRPKGVSVPVPKLVVFRWGQIVGVDGFFFFHFRYRCAGLPKDKVRKRPSANRAVVRRSPSE